MTHRLIAHGDGYTELYDHRTAEGESQHLTEKDPNTVEALMKILSDPHKP